MNASLAPHGLAAAAILLLIAGLCDALGNRAVVLLVNRISPRAFAVSLLASALLFAGGAALWMWGAWLAAARLFGVRDTLAHFVVVLSLAYAPFLLGALALLPLLGPLLHWGLRLWSFVAGLSLLALLGLNAWQALLCAAGGALLVQGVHWLFSEPAAFVARSLWAALAGRPRPLRPHLPRAIPGYAAPGAESARAEAGVGVGTDMAAGAGADAGAGAQE